MELKMVGNSGTMNATDDIFGREFNESLVHQVVVAYQANARIGSRAQKDRGAVNHSTKKPWRQKGTGRARAGMTSSPLWRGGGLGLLHHGLGDLYRWPHEHVAAIRARHRSLDQQELPLGIDAHHNEIGNGASLVAEMARHALAPKYVRRALILPGRAGNPVRN